MRKAPLAVLTAGAVLTGGFIGAGANIMKDVSTTYGSTAEQLSLPACPPEQAAYLGSVAGKGCKLTLIENQPDQAGDKPAGVHSNSVIIERGVREAANQIMRSQGPALQSGEARP